MHNGRLILRRPLVRLRCGSSCMLPCRLAAILRCTPLAGACSQLLAALSDGSQCPTAGGAVACNGKLLPCRDAGLPGLPPLLLHGFVNGLQLL
jgi:hypothetical protein